jgi:hypothetical protein
MLVMTKSKMTIQALKKEKQRLLKKLSLPEEALPGSLVSSRFRCGKTACHCRDGEGHEKWSLTYMDHGVKRVKHIPADLVEEVRQKVAQGRFFKETLNEVLVTNAELLVLRKAK